MALTEVPIINDQLDTLNEKMNALNHLISHQNATIDLLASDKRAALSSNIEAISEMIRNDELLEEMDYGDKVAFPWSNDTTNYNPEMNLCHIEDGELEDGETIKTAIFEWDKVIPFGMPFDAPEAIFASASDLAAGTYYFKIVNDSWGGNNNKYVSFTLSETLTAGKQIRKKSGAYNAAIENCTLGIFTNGLDLTGTELSFTVSTTQPSSGTSLGQTDATGDLNHWQRIVLGYNRWSQSNLRQFLNSTATKGNWWTQQNKWDVAPSQHTSYDGLLHGYASDYLAHFPACKTITVASNLDGNAVDVTYDRVFLASLEQMYITPQESTPSSEGAYWEYYKRLLGRTTPAPYSQTYARLIKYDLASPTTARYRVCRSAALGDLCFVWFIYASGYVGGGGAYGADCCAPCLRIH